MYLRSLFQNHPQLQQLSRNIHECEQGSHVGICGLTGSSKSLLLLALQEELDCPLCIISADRTRAETLIDDLQSQLGNQARPLLAHHTASDTRPSQESVETLRMILQNEVRCLVLTPEILLRDIPAADDLHQKIVHLTAGEEIEFSALATTLGDRGFLREDFVRNPGDFAVRGGIFDVYPFAGDHPIRLEFFGDRIESIREFDTLSQRSIKELSGAAIVPNLLEIGTEVERSNILEFVPENSIVVLDDPEMVLSNLERSSTDTNNRSPASIIEQLTHFRMIHVYSLVTAEKKPIDFATSPQPAFNGSIALLRKHLGNLQQTQYSVIFTCDSSSEQSRLQELLKTDQLPEGEAPTELDISLISYSHDAIHEGFAIPAQKVAVFTEHQIFGRLKRRGKGRKSKFRGFAQGEVEQLRRGDYVVHIDYGIGVYDGLKKIKVRNIEQEVVKVLYAEKDVLYVNFNYIHKLQKYSSKEGHVPKLTRLGSGEWDKIKARTRKRIQDIARDLIGIYAKRRMVQGVAFAPDAPWQKELEASFMYEDTFDQAKATRDVKADMEAAFPMDRLICGDVGFGKTEVAVRAAFKAVLNGKQVALLVPTTILAMQHFNTFLDRTSRYGTRVQVLSRFKTRKEQLAILQELEAGSIDIVIGTHRLLSKDVRIKNLGLLIIDEEHRFGVSAKEKMRALKTEVDTLTLTATPIPRTLHFSLLGARDLSIIATPPRNRLPVITEITTYNAEIIREAVIKEHQRGGQVYFVHDRVQDIEDVAERVRKAVPGVSVRHAHGQMNGHELEEVMLAFYQKRFDVLVSTKIIESGLDVPNANTIIINRADRFGMAELYQLRGRVGRSNIQAYAFLLIPPVASLPRGTVQRLQAVEEHTDLGAGFHLAMRDLEIRGAGNLLGAEQSGFIETMGFETYTRILEDAVAELKENEFKEIFSKEGLEQHRKKEATVDADIEAIIPESYIENHTERLDVYRKLYGVRTKAQLLEVSDELQDRFGKSPVEVDNLIRIVEIKLAAAHYGFIRVQIEHDQFVLDFPFETDTVFYESAFFQRLMETISTTKGGRERLQQEGKSLRLVILFAQNGVDILDQTLDYIHSLASVSNEVKT